MKIEHNTLDFQKQALVELNNQELSRINGGSDDLVIGLIYNVTKFFNN